MLQKIWRAITHSDGKLRSFCGNCEDLKGKRCSSVSGALFTFNRCLRQGSVEVPRLWQRIAAQLLASAQEKWKQKNMAHQICGFVWADNFWSMSHTKRNVEQMLCDLIEEAEKWDLAPKPGSLWWTSTYLLEDRSEVFVATNGLMYKFTCEEKIEILGCAMNRQGKTLDAIEERMQSANKASWRDILVYRSKDVPWRITSAEDWWTM